MRLLSCVCCCALAAVFARAEDPKPAQPAGNWVTVKGQVVFPEKGTDSETRSRSR